MVSAALAAAGPHKGDPFAMRRLGEVQDAAAPAPLRRTRQNQEVPGDASEVLEMPYHPCVIKSVRRKDDVTSTRQQKLLGADVGVVVYSGVV